MPNLLLSVPLSPFSVFSMMPNVINKFLDSTLHKVLPGLVSAQSKPVPLSPAVLRPGLAGALISGADPDLLTVAEEDSEAVAGSMGDSSVII